MDFYSWVRLFNVCVCLAAFVLHIWKANNRSRATRSSEAAFFTVTAWCVAYVAGVTTATLLPGAAGGPGPWSLILTIPSLGSLWCGILLTQQAETRVVILKEK